ARRRSEKPPPHRDGSWSGLPAGGLEMRFCRTVTYTAGNSDILVPMRFTTVITILLLCAGVAVAQNSTSDMLRKGILAEDEQQNPGAAIQQYQAVLNQFADERVIAATALFRMAECYRKQGNKRQAVAAYQRVL